MPWRSEWVPSPLKVLHGSHCPGRGPDPPSGRKALPPSTSCCSAGLCLGLSLPFFFASWPKGHHLWEAISGHSCLQGR